MSSQLQQKSIALRHRGYSIRDISRSLNIAQSTASVWVRGVQLTQKQKVFLKNKNHSLDNIKKRRITRLRNEALKRKHTIDISAHEIGKIDQNMLKILGIGIYLGEGGKTLTGMARISNSDPAVIAIAMRFFREICDVKEDRFRAHIHIHSPEAVKDAEKYWSRILKIPLSQFYKTYVIKSKNLHRPRKTLPHGTLDIGVCDTQLLLKILGWIEGVKRNI